MECHQLPHSTCKKYVEYVLKFEISKNHYTHLGCMCLLSSMFCLDGWAKLALHKQILDLG